MLFVAFGCEAGDRQIGTLLEAARRYGRRVEQFAVRRIPPSGTWPLRRQVLRPGQPPEASMYPGDDAPDTWHFGAYCDGDCVGIMSLYTEPRPGAAPPGYRLRGMATAPHVRGTGAGVALLAAALDHVAARGGGEVWCNARAGAIGFYGRAGFDIVSEPFEIPGIGTHVVMQRRVQG